MPSSGLLFFSQRAPVATDIWEFPWMWRQPAAMQAFCHPFEECHVFVAPWRTKGRSNYCVIFFSWGVEIELQTSSCIFWMFGCGFQRWLHWGSSSERTDGLSLMDCALRQNNLVRFCVSVRLLLAKGSVWYGPFISDFFHIQIAQLELHAKVFPLGMVGVAGCVVIFKGKVGGRGNRMSWIL